MMQKKVFLALLLMLVLMLWACDGGKQKPVETQQVTETQPVTEQETETTVPPQPDTVEFAVLAGVCVPEATVYEMPDGQTACGTLQEGEKVQLQEKTTDDLWYKCDMGWVKAEELYIFENGQESEKYAVARAEAPCYDHIGGNATGECYAAGDRILISCQLGDGEKLWGKTENGWVDMDHLYIEGETGLRPVKGIVIDTTPLNVRLGPSTKQEVKDTIEVGLAVEVLEQVTVEEKDWGYVYFWKSTDTQNGYYMSGWVYMPMVSGELYDWIYSDSEVKESWVASKKPVLNKNSHMYNVDYSVFQFYEDGKFTQSFSSATNYSERLDSSFSIEVLGGPIGYYTSTDYGTYTMENGVLTLNYMYTETIDEFGNYFKPYKKTVTAYYELDETGKIMTLGSASALFRSGYADNRMCKLPDQWQPSDVGIALDQLFMEPETEDEQQW